MKSKIIDFSNLKEILLEVWSLEWSPPLALAFGVQSGMGATAGLYGAIMVGIFAAYLVEHPLRLVALLDQ
jgi:SulP family sulfate permease